MSRIRALATIWIATFAASTSPAFATQLALFTFETSPPAAVSNTATYPNAISADAGTGSAAGVHSLAATDWSAPAGNGSATSFSVNNWSVGDYFQFQVSTVNFEDVIFSWHQVRSATGPGGADTTTNNFRLQYSTDGTTFSNFADYLVPSNITWSSGAADVTNTTVFSQNLSAIAAIENQATVYFRLTSLLASSNVAAGASRVDNIAINATPIPEPASLTLLSFGALAMMLVRRRGN